MTDVTALLAGIKTRALAAMDYPGHVTVEQSAADVPRLVAAIEAVEEQAWACDELAEITPNETAAEALRLAARGIRAAVVAALGGGE